MKVKIRMGNPEILFPLGLIAALVLVLLGASCALNGIGKELTRAERMEKMGMLLPEGGALMEEAYEGTDANIRAVFRGENGYVIETETDGYVAPIAMRIGVDAQGRVTGLQIRSMNETVGLGMRALRDRAFLSQFLNRQGSVVIGEDVDAISGATVTSKAIARSVNSASGFVRGADADSGATAWGGEA